MQRLQTRTVRSASPNLVALELIMSDSQKNTRSFLGFRKKSLEDELLALHPDLMKDYIDVCSAIQGIENSGAKHQISSSEFTKYRGAIDAIDAYLDKVNEFKDPDELADVLIDGGYAPLDKKRRPNIMDSIRYHTTRSKRLVLKDGKVGKADWLEDGSPPGPLKKDPKN